MKWNNSVMYSVFNFFLFFCIKNKWRLHITYQKKRSVFQNTQKSLSFFFFFEALLWSLTISPKPKNYQNTPKTQKLPKYPWNPKKTKIPPNPKNFQNTLEIQKKMTKIPLKPKKLNKIPPKPKNYQNSPKTQKMTKIPLKPKKWPK